MVLDGNQSNSDAVATERVIAYVDGFNLYFGMREGFLDRFYWLDVHQMVLSIVRPKQTLLATKYFTSRVTAPAGKNKRQGDYLDALRANSKIEVIFGKYEHEKCRCNHCGGEYTIHGEKMTDVNIAVEMTKDAHADRFDTAILVTGDSDQKPTVRMVKELFSPKRLLCLFPPNRHSNALENESHAVLQVKDHMLSKGQMAASVILPSGVVLTRPTEWSAAGAADRRAREAAARTSRS